MHSNRAKHSSLTKVVTRKLPPFKTHLHSLTQDPFMKKVTFLALQSPSECNILQLQMKPMVGTGAQV